MRRAGFRARSSGSSMRRRTNAIQYKWLMLLTAQGGMPFVVGDDDQCLAAGTLVTMGDGAKRAIESIVAGDSVLSNYGGGDLRPAPRPGGFRRRRQGRIVCGRM